MAAKIYSTDSPRDIAEKIYKSFDKGDMVQVFGWVQTKDNLIDKGEAVLECLRWFYEFEHFGHGGRARELKYRKNAIGGPIAHPIFTWEKRIIDQEPRYTIWRLQ